LVPEVALGHEVLPVVGGLLEELLRQAVPVFRPRDRREHCFGVDRHGTAHLADDRARHRNLVGVIRDAEAGPQTDPRCVLSQNSRPQRMECRKRHAPRFAPCKPANALAHLPCRLVRERHGEDRSRFRAAPEQVDDTVRDDAGLAGARAGQDEQRALRAGDGRALGGVQLSQQSVRALHRPASKWGGSTSSCDSPFADRTASQRLSRGVQ
jgi:hypothetical protein